MSDERIILIKGDKTKWYDQIIFILKKNVPKNKVPIDLVVEAERIVNSYFVRQQTKTLPYKKIPSVNVAPKKKVKPRISTFDFILNSVMLLSLITLVVMLFWLM